MKASNELLAQKMLTSEDNLVSTQSTLKEQKRQLKTLNNELSNALRKADSAYVNGRGDFFKEQADQRETEKKLKSLAKVCNYV